MMCSNSTTLCALLVSTVVLISGNVIPISIEAIPNRWIPTANQGSSYQSTIQPESVQSFSAYQPIHRDNFNRFKSANYGSPQISNKDINKQLDTPNSKGSRVLQSEPTSTLPEPKPRREDVLQEKLGFSMLSSLLPTSILNSPPQKPEDSDNLIETDAGQQASFLDGSGLQKLQQLFQNQGQSSNGGYDSAPSSEQFISDPQNSQEEESDSGNGLFSRIRNAIPFGSGLLTGLLSNGETNNDEGEQADETGGVSYDMPNMGHNDISEDGSHSANLFSLNPSQISFTNQDTNFDTSESETGSSLLSAFPNPITSLKNLFSSFKTSSTENNEQQLESGGGYVDEPNQPLDSAITPYQSLADGSFNGVFKALVPYLSHVATALGLAKAKLPLIKLLGAVLGPILATAIAAMVIGIVYVSIYVSASAIRNEDVEGEIFLLSMKQLMNILGIPDPLEELFDISIFRSLQGRSTKSRSLKATSSKEILNLTGNTNHTDMCIERIACHALGKKLVGSKPTWKDGWVGKGIRWISGNVNTTTLNNETTSNYYFKIIRNGKSLIDAITVGMDHKTNAFAWNNNLNSVCDRYTCDPIMYFKTIFT